MISLHELNASSIIRKLAIIERDPKILWKSIEEEYGFGFFRKVVEEDYGLVEDLEIMKKDLVKAITFDRIEHIQNLQQVS